MTEFPLFDAKLTHEWDKKQLYQNGSLRMLFQSYVRYDVGEDTYLVPVRGMYPNPSTAQDAVEQVQHFIVQCVDTIKQAKVDPAFKIEKHG